MSEVNCSGGTQGSQGMRIWRVQLSPGPLGLFQVIARTKSEARAHLKRLLKGPIPKGAKLYEVERDGD